MESGVVRFLAGPLEELFVEGMRRGMEEEEGGEEVLGENLGGRGGGEKESGGEGEGDKGGVGDGIALEGASE